MVLRVGRISTPLRWLVIVVTAAAQGSPLLLDRYRNRGKGGEASALVSNDWRVTAAPKAMCKGRFREWLSLLTKGDYRIRRY
jgi:hypothetical protein